jgi:hypothetical protein
MGELDSLCCCGHSRVAWICCISGLRNHVRMLSTAGRRFTLPRLRMFHAV